MRSDPAQDRRADAQLSLLCLQTLAVRRASHLTRRVWRLIPRREHLTICPEKERWSRWGCTGDEPRSRFGNSFQSLALVFLLLSWTRWLAPALETPRRSLDVGCSYMMVWSLSGVAVPCRPPKPGGT